MYLAWRDLWVARGRFVLVGIVIALVSLLAGLLSGLATGLVDDGISGLRRLPLTHLAFQEGAGVEFSRSSLDADNVRPWLEAMPDDAAPIGMSFFNARTPNGVTIDLALFGTSTNSFLAPEDEARQALEQGGLVLSDEFESDDLKVGDRLMVIGPDVELPILGFTYSGSYGHVDIAFTSLETWQNLVFGDSARGRLNAIAIRDQGNVDLQALAEASDTVVHTKTAAYNGSPGFAAESATMSLIRGFLIVIAAMVIGAFFTVWTVQRTHQIGLLKALGASTSYVVRDALGQLAVVITASTLFGSLLAGVIGMLISDQAPFRIDPKSLVSTAVLLIAAGMVGSLVALRRITHVDPAVAMASTA